MNLATFQTDVAQKMARKLADAEDLGVYAMVQAQYATVVARGENPADYELVAVDDKYPRLKPDGTEISFRFRYGVVKRSAVEAMPMVRGFEDEA